MGRCNRCGLPINDGVDGSQMDARHYDCVRIIAAEMSRRDQSISVLSGALHGLVARLDFIRADETYRGVWTFYMVHGQKYDGPTYVDALAEARSAISSTTAPPGASAIDAALTPTEKAAADLLAACYAARTRFSDQNGQVSEKVWADNYPAVKQLDEAIHKAIP